MKFRSLYNKGEYTFKSPTGEKIEIRHDAKVNSEGRRILKPTRKVAIYDLIQTHREECEIENIIRRAVEGDYTALNAVNGIYTDITNCPSSLAEAQQFIINQKEEFEKLPKEIKAKFEFNPDLYIAEMGNNVDSWCDKMGLKEKWLQEDENRKTEQLTKENFTKVMADLAAGKTIKQTESEMITNE